MSKDKSKRVLNKLNNEVDFHFLLQPSTCKTK